MICFTIPQHFDDPLSYSLKVKIYVNIILFFIEKYLQSFSATRD